MASVGNHPIYDALPISNDVLDKGGMELLRAAVVDEELFIVARSDVFPGPGPWGLVLADIARRLASLYAADGQFTEAEVTAAITDTIAQDRKSTRLNSSHPSNSYATSCS